MPLDAAIVEKAVVALQKHVTLEKGGSKQLFPENDDTIISANITVSKIPSNPPKKPITIHLPHDVIPTSSEPEICLFTKDPQREYKDILDKVGLGKIRVIGISKLKTKHTPTHEARRRLCNAYDIFLADDRIVPLLPRILGKPFHSKRKRPIPVDISGCGSGRLKRESNSSGTRKKNNRNLRNAEGDNSEDEDDAGAAVRYITEARLVRNITRGIASTQLYLNGGGCNFALRVGVASMEAAAIAENVGVAVEKAVEKFKGGWGDVMSVVIKTANSVALPVYRQLPEAGKKRSRDDEDDEDEEVATKKRKTVAAKKTPAKAKKTPAKAKKTPAKAAAVKKTPAKAVTAKKTPAKSDAKTPAKKAAKTPAKTPKAKTPAKPSTPGSNKRRTRSSRK